MLILATSLLFLLCTFIVFIIRKSFGLYKNMGTIYSSCLSLLAKFAQISTIKPSSF